MTTYVVYHIASTQQIKSFNCEASAKRSTTCSNRNALRDTNVKTAPYAYTTYENYTTNVVKKIKVRSLMTGQEVEIDSNTPRCCDPSSETFWSM